MSVACLVHACFYMLTCTCTRLAVKVANLTVKTCMSLCKQMPEVERSGHCASKMRGNRMHPCPLHGSYTDSYVMNLLV